MCFSAWSRSSREAVPGKLNAPDGGKGGGCNVGAGRGGVGVGAVLRGDMGADCVCGTREPPATAEDVDETAAWSGVTFVERHAGASDICAALAAAGVLGPGGVGGGISFVGVGGGGCSVALDATNVDGVGATGKPTADDEAEVRPRRRGSAELGMASAAGSMRESSDSEDGDGDGARRGGECLSGGSAETDQTKGRHSLALCTVL